MLLPLLIKSLDPSQISEDEFFEKYLSYVEIGKNSCHSELVVSEYFNYSIKQIMFNRKKVSDLNMSNTKYREKCSGP